VTDCGQFVERSVPREVVGYWIADLLAKAPTWGVLALRGCRAMTRNQRGVEAIASAAIAAWNIA
jgi:hypothetical protein